MHPISGEVAPPNPHKAKGGGCPDIGVTFDIGVSCSVVFIFIYFSITLDIYFYIG
jgi:hypothetical protein